jgi:hypothetical protein
MSAWRVRTRRRFVGGGQGPWVHGPTSNEQEYTASESMYIPSIAQAGYRPCLSQIRPSCLRSCWRQSKRDFDCLRHKSNLVISLASPSGHLQVRRCVLPRASGRYRLEVDLGEQHHLRRGVAADRVRLQRPPRHDPSRRHHHTVWYGDALTGPVSITEIVYIR